MHPLLRLPYAALGAAAEAATAIAPPNGPKWQRALHARRGLAARLQAFGTQRDTERPLVWLHAPSAGEALQALPVAQRLRGRTHPPQLALTWYSPSGAPFAQRFDVDFRDYLPFDTTRGARTALDALRPTALVYSKLDVWPVLTAAAGQRGTPVGMISATVSPGSGRRSTFAKLLLADAYARLDLVGAITADDAERLTDLGVRRDALRITGDTRFDQVWERAQRVDHTGPLLRQLASDRPTLVAGSTWPADEVVLTAAWKSVARAVPGVRLIIAPHEPTPAHIAPIQAWARSAALSAALFRDAASAQADVIVVDTVGALGDLYALATVAFVGGGFHIFGLHSVLEPAAFGVPVVHGLLWHDSPDAGRLIAAGGARAARSAPELAEALILWLGDRAAAETPARAAAAFVRAELGAADRATALVEALGGGSEKMRNFRV